MYSNCSYMIGIAALFVDKSLQTLQEPLLSAIEMDAPPAVSQSGFLDDSGICLLKLDITDKSNSVTQVELCCPGGMKYAPTISHV